MIWYRTVIQKLEASDLFCEVSLMGAKVRAIIDTDQFLDIHYDPTTESYSYAFIDLTLPYAGDKRRFGWDDYPHEGVTEIEHLESYPHHFHRRARNGNWIFETSPMRGNIENEIDTIITTIENYLS